MQEEIQTRVFDALVNNNKIPYTDGGIAIIETQIRGALELGQRRGGIAPTEYDENGEEWYLDGSWEESGWFELSGSELIWHDGNAEHGGDSTFIK